MAQAQAVINFKHPRKPSLDGSEELIGAFQQRKSKELVIAFAGPIGCDIKSIVEHTAQQLSDMGYVDVVRIKLSDFISQARTDGLIQVDLTGEDQGGSEYDRYRNLQEGGRVLRSKTKNMAILAEYAVKKIKLDRELRKQQAGDAQVDEKTVPEKVAYLIDQVKRPEEVGLLRAIYRNIFYLVGVTRIAEKRVTSLRSENIPDEKIHRLINIDKREGKDDGQRLEKTLELADYFLRNDAAVEKTKVEKVRRLLDLVHGNTAISPTKDEQGMYVAYAAGLRSACLSRQVGAALANDRGEIISTGCNDVPKAGGGLYGSGEKIDYRCIHHEKQICFNVAYKRNLQNEIGDEVRSAINELPEILRKQLPDSLFTDIQDRVYENTRVKSLIEFSRSVHAEMDAIIAAARSGNRGVVNGTLYTTTFPCHSCARHIVAAGITRVYYIEPYEKSLAKNLHEDSIEFEVEPIPVVTTPADSFGKVAFLHYEGVSPRKFQNFFQAGQRKDEKTGKVTKFEKKTAEKIVPEYLDDYQEFELKALEHLETELSILKQKAIDEGN